MTTNLGPKEYLRFCRGGSSQGKGSTREQGSFVKGTERQTLFQAGAEGIAELFEEKVTWLVFQTNLLE